MAKPVVRRPPTFALNTKVPAERSRSEIERMLREHGAKRVGNVADDDRASILFELGERVYRISVPTKMQIKTSIDADQRRRWRVLFLCVKAKLCAVNEGVETNEGAFLSDAVAPDGRTLREHDEAGSLALADGDHVLKLPAPKTA